MLEIPENFLKEEIRNDYLVSTKIKKVWARELDLLNEFQRVCSKYGLKYYVGFGSLIGTIRHKGFIPWDDDIDLLMMRTDYEKLVQVSRDEFKYPYFFQDAYSDGLARGYARLRNSATTALSKTYLSHDMNQGIFIDIFPVDSLPDDERTRTKWLKQINNTFTLMNALFLEETWKDRSLPKRLFLKTFKKVYTLPRLAKHYDKLCAKYKSEETQYVRHVAFTGGKVKTLWKRQWFEQSVKYPFEFTTINVPSGYHELLFQQYGDYMIMKKAPNVHGKVLFDPDMPYTEYLSTHTLDEINEELQNL